MFTPIELHMQLSRNDRRKHLKLEENCLMIGGGSKEYRGLLAHHLKTTIPSGKDIVLCHACHNGKCSNVNHLYWGTQRDNFSDQIENGSVQSIKERMISKYGESGYHDIVSESTRKARAVSREVNMLSSEQWESIKNAIDSVPRGRGRISKLTFILNVSHTQVRRYMKKLGLDK